MSSGKVILGLMAGFTAGTLLGMLFAPHHNDNSSFWGCDKDADDADEKVKDSIDELTEKIKKLKVEISSEKSKNKGK